MRDLSAQRFDDMNQCWYGRVTFSEFEWPWGYGCDSVQTAARDSDGELWLFSSACLPDGFEPANAPAVGQCEARNPDLVEVYFQTVDTQQGCLEAPVGVFSDKDPDDACFSEGPTVARSGDLYFVYENGCLDGGVQHATAELQHFSEYEDCE